jgi:hypothetical protein
MSDDDNSQGFPGGEGNQVGEEETREQFRQREKRVLTEILEQSATMDCGEMLQRLASIGWDAALAYDDDGHWAMPESGIAPIPKMKLADWEGTYFASKHRWRETPRAALIRAIELHIEGKDD